jgi:hypothetical protein
METGRSANALPFSKEVCDFIRAAENLLSHGLRTSELTPDECEIIGEYVITMSKIEHPWSRTLPIKYP